MPSGTLSCKERKWFSPALFWKNLCRFWPLWAGYAALEFFVVPMNLFLSGEQAARRGVSPAWNMQDVMDGAIVSSGWLSAVFGVFFAMALFSYLMDHRACQMLHALPVRREGLFATNYALGVSWFAVPVAAMGVLCMVAGAVYGVNLVPEALVWMLGQTVTGVFFFSFAVFCAMFTGHLLALPVFYGILNVLVFGLSILLDSAMDMLLVGYAGNDLVYTAFTVRCTPIWYISQRLWVERAYAESGVRQSLSVPGLAGCVAYCLVLAAIFVAVALLVYRRRQLERSGDLVTVGWVRPVFQWGLGVCVGLVGGIWLYGRFFDSYSPWLLVAFATLWAVVGAFAGRMLLKKTLRVFADGWKTPMAVGAVMLVVMGAARLDVFGYQRWVPQAGQVAKVSIGWVQSAPWDDGNYRYLNFEDPADVAAVVAFHQALVEELDTLEASRRGGVLPTSGETVDGYQTYSDKGLTMEYIMADGSRVRRTWEVVPVTAAALADGDSYAYQLQALFNRPGVAARLYDVELSQRGAQGEVTAVGGWLQNVTVVDDDPAKYAGSYDVPVETVDNELRLTADEAQTLYLAVKRDLAAGNIGRRYLLDDRERYQNCSLTDLRLELMLEWIDSDGDRQTDSNSVRITMQKSATETMKALRQLGYADWLLEHGE